MARPLRVDFPGARHHVMNRGARKEAVFRDDGDCGSFCLLLGEVAKRYGLVIHGFALMPNHFHLMLESVNGNLSQGMATLSSRYSMRFNRQRGKDSPVFKGRFRNRVVSDPGHWLYLLAYLHLNPVRANLVLNPDRYDWTSHRFYTGQDRPPAWLRIDDLSAELGGVGGYRRYLKEVRSRRRPTPEGFDGVLFEGRVSSALQPVKQPVAPRKLSADEALRQVLHLTGASARVLQQTIRGCEGNPVRAVAAWWLIHGAGLNNVEAARRLGMSAVAVSKALKRLNDMLTTDPDSEAYHWVVELQQLLEERKGQ